MVKAAIPGLMAPALSDISILISERDTENLHTPMVMFLRYVCVM